MAGRGRRFSSPTRSSEDDDSRDTDKSSITMVVGRGRRFGKSAEGKTQLRKPVTPPAELKKDFSLFNNSGSASTHSSEHIYSPPLASITPPPGFRPILGQGSTTAGKVAPEVSDTGGSGDVSPTPTSTKKYELSVDAKEFVPSYMQMNSAASTAAVNTDCTFANTTATEVEQMYDAVLKLTTSPGFFYDYINPLMESLNSVDSIDVLSACVNVIIEQALLEPNFTYSGARLCNYLSENLQTKVKHSKSDNVFRKVMLDRLKELHLDRLEIVSSDENKLQGLLMFMGELFMQMEILRELFFSKILEVIKTLVDNPSDGNLKCVAQLFKMAGALLEITQQESGPSRLPGQITLQTIFDQLKELTIDNGVSKSIKSMLMEVIELKASNWGQFTNVMMMKGDSNSLDPVSQFSSVPVFYSPEGNPIPIEQMGYYFDNEFGDYVPYSTDDDNSDYQYSMMHDSTYDDGMDEEMQRAFEKFLLETEGSQ